MNISERTISPDFSLIESLKKMDSIDKKLLLVLKNGKFSGLLSSGDIQRAIIMGISLDEKVKNILRKNIKVARPEDPFEQIKQMMFEFRMEFCPVVAGSGEIKKVYFWEELFRDNELLPVRMFNLPVVIMAGGFGTRLRPLTHVLPKPLIPLKDKTMLEEIFNRFGRHGSNEFYISVNYKSELIEYYINSQNLPVTASFFKEEKPMGTAGSLSMLKGKIERTFFVSNCDIIIEQDYSEILDYHQENKNEITIVAALKNYTIPYGTLETGENGQLIELNEKPDLTFKINSGMYILEPHLLNEIPDDTFFHITHLIDKVKTRNGKVGVFPVSEKSWKDMGEWDEYIKNLVK